MGAQHLGLFTASAHKHSQSFHVCADLSAEGHHLAQAFLEGARCRPVVLATSSRPGLALEPLAHGGVQV